jgi:hypothetical protein
LPAGLSWVEVVAGHVQSLGRRSDGSLVAWGDNSYGQSNVPALPTGLAYTGMSGGIYHSVALRSDGTIVSFGSNFSGQLNVPALPAGLVYTAVSACASHNVALRSDGFAVAWGFNGYGQCNVPALPAGMTYVAVDAGNSHSVALRSDATIVCWGRNNFGQCNTPALPPGMNYVEVAAGGERTIARFEPICTPAVTYCTAGVSTNGCAATLSAIGSPSASGAGSFAVTASSVEGQKLGLIYYGTSGTLSAPWGGSSSFMCVKPPQQRTTQNNSGGTIGVCDGTLVLDWNAYMASHPGALGQPFSAGDQAYLQGWYRDPPSPKTTALTDALQVFVCP